MFGVKLRLTFLGCPLEGRVRFGDEGGQAEAQLRPSPGGFLAQGVDFVDQVDDALYVVGGLRGQAEHKV